MSDKEIQVITLWYNLRNEYYQDKSKLSLMEYVYHRCKTLIEEKSLDHEQFYNIISACTTYD